MLLGQLHARCKAFVTAIEDINVQFNELQEELHLQELETGTLLDMDTTDIDVGDNPVPTLTKKAGSAKDKPSMLIPEKASKP